MDAEEEVTALRYAEAALVLVAGEAEGAGMIALWDNPAGASTVPPVSGIEKGRGDPAARVQAKRRGYFLSRSRISVRIFWSVVISGTGGGEAGSARLRLFMPLTTMNSTQAMMMKLIATVRKLP